MDGGVLLPTVDAPSLPHHAIDPARGFTRPPATCKP